MLNDPIRTRVIEGAIAGLPLEGLTVFEIGSGCGLVALLFAKYGARRVVTCEMNQTLASLAQDVVSRSPFADRITVLPISSSEAIDGGHLSAELDVIFTETVDCGVIGEGFFSIAKDIKRVAYSDTIILPHRIRQYGAPVMSPALHGLNCVDTVAGFDLTPLNRYSTANYFPVHSVMHPHTILAQPELLRTYSYRVKHDNHPVEMVIEQSGCLHGAITWFALEMGAHVATNEPGAASHWHQAYHPLANPLMVEKGQSISIGLNDCGELHVTG